MSRGPHDIWVVRASQSCCHGFVSQFLNVARVIGLVGLALVMLGCNVLGGGVPPEGTPSMTPVATPSVVPAATMSPTRVPSPTPPVFRPVLPPTFTTVVTYLPVEICRTDRILRDPPHPDCTIKGALSPDGSRYFYVPGDRLYAAVAVDPARGERWFATAAEAIGAGWRPARELENRSPILR